MGHFGDRQQGCTRRGAETRMLDEGEACGDQGFLPSVVGNQEGQQAYISGNLRDVGRPPHEGGYQALVRHSPEESRATAETMNTFELRALAEEGV